MKGKTMEFLDDALVCPNCGLNWLHHYQIDAFERDEDAETGLHIRVTKDRAEIDGNLEENPSGRRHGLAITFFCEQCPARPVLNIYQHKGQEFVEWAFPVAFITDAEEDLEEILHK